MSRGGRECPVAGEKGIKEDTEGGRDGVLEGVDNQFPEGGEVPPQRVRGVVEEVVRVDRVRDRNPDSETRGGRAMGTVWPDAREGARVQDRGGVREAGGGVE